MADGLVFECRSFFTRVLLLGMLLTSSANGIGQAQTLYLVDTVMDAPASQLATPDGLISLREAVLAASTNQRFGDAPAGSLASQDVIKIVVSGTIDLHGGELISVGPLNLQGPGATQLTIDAHRKCRALSCWRDPNLSSATFINISGLRIINGASDSLGGGILTNEEMYLAEVEIALCSAQKGGGIASVAMQSGSTSILYFYRSTIAENMATERGGGIYLGEFASLWLLNSTVAKCVSGQGGGGIAIHNVPQSYRNHSLVNSTVVDNLCASVVNEPGMDLSGGLGVFSTDSYMCYASNTVFAQNRNVSLGSPADIESPLDFRGYSNFIGAVGGNFPVQNGQWSNQVGTTLNPLQPALGVLNYYGGKTRCMRPLSASPLINAGRNDVATQFSVDQRGWTRIRGGLVDIGSVER